MTPVDLTTEAASLIQTALTLRRYYEGCQCESCDALRPFRQAFEKLCEANLALCQSPSPQERAETLSRQVAQRQSPLAVAVERQVNSARYDLYLNGQVLMTGWAHEILTLCQKKGYDLTIIS